MSGNKEFIVLNSEKEAVENSTDPLILSKKLVTLVLK